MKELKSAFEIEGFLDGTCEIKHVSGEKYRYVVKFDEIQCYNEYFKTWTVINPVLSYFIKKEFKKVEDVVYIHKFWRRIEEDYQYMKMKTTKTWEQFLDTYPPRKENCILIKTTTL